MAFKAYKVVQPLMEQMQQLQQLQSNPFMTQLVGNTTMEDLIKGQSGQNLWNAAEKKGQMAHLGTLSIKNIERLKKFIF